MLPRRLSFLRSLGTLFSPWAHSYPASASPVAPRRLGCEELENRVLPRGIINPIIGQPSPPPPPPPAIVQLAPLATVALPMVASGTNDLVTIVVGKTNGTVASGLRDADFTFFLSGGTSSVESGPVTETSTPGTYTTTFTGRTAGTPSTLTVSVDGIYAPSHPTIQVTPGAVSAANTTVNVATPAVASGDADVVTISVKDAAGNAVTTLGDAAFRFALSGGISAGAFGPVTQTASPGTYTATFIGGAAGTPSALTVSVTGVQAASHPTIQVTPGAVSATTSTVAFAAPSVTAGDGDVVTISVKDAAGNAITGLPGGAFQLTLSGGASAGALGPVAEIGTSGVYAAAFTGTQVGTPSALTVAVAGLQLDSRPTVQVTPVAPPPAPAAAPAPVFSGVFMFGNMMVLQGEGVPGGVVVVPLPPGAFALFADANGDGHGDVVLLVPHMIFVLDGLTGAALAVPF